ncbi:MAG: 4-(cytidine 5'-diphospho)-2-C-methyl-D-erythritol kinase [Ignavibacteriales bacterium]|nr:4-(cytidine 5'-diphospho)-2-C-methyl-D-erythritol kinase [Ignavibacteriales bacterium]
MNKLTLNAPAKINIGLNIVSKRSDGFHNLETFFYPIYDLYDTIIFEQSNHYIFDTNHKELNRDPDNLITKAHTIIEKYVNKKLPIKITLIKNIPIGAGLGGGSSDAAATLIGLNEFFELEIGLNKLNEFALKLGSDVPFFIKSKPAVGYSRGEILSQSNVYITKPILIVNPGIHISTKEAFNSIIPKDSDFNYEYFSTNDSIDFTFLQNEIRNDFEKYVFKYYPEIKLIKDIMIESKCLFSLMSGTGSTVYGIFDNLESAESAAEKLPSTYFRHISNLS